MHIDIEAIFTISPTTLNFKKLVGPNKIPLLGCHFFTQYQEKVCAHQVNLLIRSSHGAHGRILWYHQQLQR
jgi:hypothetical protein